MKLEQQVVSLTLAQKLKELGVKQESLYYHWYSPVGWSIVDRVFKLTNTGVMQCPSAFTVAELGEMLPNKIEKKDNKFWLYHWKSKDSDYSTCYGTFNSKGLDLFHTEDADTEADARAKILIYLLENSLLENKLI